MEIHGKVHCMFEQSGTFKNEFKKLGIDAYDYDIQNNFGQTDFQIDLFAEIDNAYHNKLSVFDSVGGGNEDLILAFLPCIYFEAMQMPYYCDESQNISHLSLIDRYKTILDRIDNRHIFYKKLYMLYAVCKIRGLRLIIENPATTPNYLIGNQNFPRYTFIDKNRMLRGDYFMKPTAYWFLNCEPTRGLTSYQNDKERKVINKCKRGKQAGICSEERSMISPDYARNFICDFILGKRQQITQLSLFDHDDF